MHRFVPNQRIVLLKAGGHVNHIPKASPALEPAKVHVEQDWAFGGADHGVAAAALYAATTAAVCVAAQMAFTRASSAL